jgi:hypothetical protein
MTTDYRALCTAHLPELRGMFERILCVARSSDGPAVGNIQLADRLINAVVNWSENSPAQPEPAPTDEEIEEWADASSEVPLEEMDPEVHGWRRCFTKEEFGETIRAVLARYGTPAYNTKGTH